jgi:hypothetical protein
MWFGKTTRGEGITPRRPHAVSDNNDLGQFVYRDDLGKPKDPSGGERDQREKDHHRQG